MTASHMTDQYIRSDFDVSVYHERDDVLDADMIRALITAGPNGSAKLPGYTAEEWGQFITALQPHLERAGVFLPVYTEPDRTHDARIAHVAMKLAEASRFIADALAADSVQARHNLILHANDAASTASERLGQLTWDTDPTKGDQIAKVFRRDQAAPES